MMRYRPRMWGTSSEYEPEGAAEQARPLAPGNLEPVTSLRKKVEGLPSNLHANIIHQTGIDLARWAVATRGSDLVTNTKSTIA